MKKIENILIILLFFIVAFLLIFMVSNFTCHEVGTVLGCRVEGWIGWGIRAIFGL